MFANRFSVDCGCCGPGPYTYFHCSPCDIPESTLTLSWYYWQVHYGGPSGTTYTGEPAPDVALPFVGVVGPTATWDSGWFAGPSDSASCNVNTGNPLLHTDCCYMRFVLDCNLALGTSFRMYLSSNADGSPGLAYCYDGTEFTTTGSATYTCSPFLAQYDNTAIVNGMFYSGILTL